MPYSNVLPLRDSPSARLTDHPRQTAFTPRPGKRARHRSNDMEVAEDERAQTGTAQPSPEGSDSSDWEDWANAMVVQGEAADGEAIARESEGREADSSTGPEAEEEAWMKRMMDQGTDRSVVQDADSRAWDYVLQMAVEAERSLQHRAGGVVTPPVQEVTGAAATEFVARWLGQSLPYSSPALHTLDYLNDFISSQRQDGVPEEFASRMVVNSIAEPSAVAMVSRSPEQSMHRILSFSLSATAGAALAAAVVQPGAAGLNPFFFNHRNTSSRDTQRDGKGDEFIGERRDGRNRGGESGRGVVFEALDSRIAEEALTAAMGRLGLVVECRSRSGMWRIPTGAELTSVLRLTAVEGVVKPLAVEDASEIAGSSHVLGLTDKSAAERMVRGLISKHASAGIRRGGHLVAWCLSFANGLAGVLCHAAAEETHSAATRDDITAVVFALLLDPVERSPLVGVGAKTSSSTDEKYTPGPLRTGERERVARAKVNSGGIVVDDDSPYVELFRELGLRRVRDADWIRFVPSRRPARSVGGGDSSGGGEEGCQPAPFIAIALHP